MCSEEPKHQATSTSTDQREHSVENLDTYVGLCQSELDRAQSSHRSLMVAAHEGDLAAIKKLLKDDLADSLLPICCQDQHGRMPLHLAAWNGHEHIVRFLLENGAVWHAQDHEALTAGEYAQMNGHEKVYQLLVDAGCRAELVLGAIQRSSAENETAGYLQHAVRYTNDQLVDDSDNGVMMQWEKPLMQRHAEIMMQGKECASGCGLDVLNIGFGLGLVDEALQALQPRSHTIVEAHPDVHRKMLEDGWHQRPGVRIVFGRWQDVIPQLVTQQYDAIMFDTFGEEYADLREFHEVVLDLLRAGGVYTFFNGLAATNPFFHDVYCQLTSLELQSFGFAVDYETISIDPESDPAWTDVKRKYWTLKHYRLPICRLTL